MKKRVSFLSIALLTTLSVTTTFSQVQKGDSNIGLNTQISSIVGTDATNANGSIFLSYQYYITNNISLGAGPLLSFSSTDATSSTTLGLNLFANYNFLLPNGKTLPYLGAQYSYSNSYIDSDATYTDVTNKSIGVNGGIKYFLSERVNLDGNLSYTSIISTSVEMDGSFFEPDPEGGIVQFTFGLGVILGKR